MADHIILKFVPFSSTVESSFWVRYSREKLETIRLSEDAIPITTYYNNEMRIQCQEDSLASQSKANECVHVHSKLIGYNTLEKFQTVNKNELLFSTFQANFFADDDATVVKSLSSALLLTFADLKQHKVIYWFAFPALVPTESIRAVSPSQIWNPTASQELSAAVDRMRRRQQTKVDDANGTTMCPYFLYDGSDTTVPLSKENYTQLQGGKVYFCFLDPHKSSHDTIGWPLRNLIAYAGIHLGLAGETIDVLSFQPHTPLRRILMEEEDTSLEASMVDVATTVDATVLHLKVSVPTDYGGEKKKVVGWELNARNKPGPRSVNLRPLLDPRHLAITAADLNLKLMKWRMIPELNVDRLQSSNVLLIGAGTLGCNVARVLLGWGVRKITLVDYGKVSYSNPVRQSLFTLEDCQGGGRPKAEAAATALQSIAADVDSTGIHLSIPMPGHVEDAASIRTAVEKLDALVEAADAVFLLTDTRESRWLPTVMAAAHDTMLINAALGLDSWLVMRHGGGHGCYYCSDVVAPENSTRNRTLDQQCTVTRPGLAMIASSMAVELMVALMHHPDGVAAAPPQNNSSQFSPVCSESPCPLGVIPHQIRGSLVSYTMMTPVVSKFPCCTGCADDVVEAYKRDKVGTTISVCQSTKFLEDLAGLTSYRAAEADKLVGIEGWDDDE